MDSEHNPHDPRSPLHPGRSHCSAARIPLADRRHPRHPGLTVLGQAAELGQDIPQPRTPAEEMVEILPEQDIPAPRTPQDLEVEMVNDDSAEVVTVPEEELEPDPTPLEQENLAASGPASSTTGSLLRSK